MVCRGEGLVDGQRGGRGRGRSRWSVGDVRRGVSLGLRHASFVLRHASRVQRSHIRDQSR